MYYKEEKKLIDLIFGSKKLSPIFFKKINYDELIVISSKNLLIPALFFELKKKNYLNHTPKEFSNYIHEIYIINRNRNEKLIKELTHLIKILEKNKISYVLLKGSEFIMKNIFKDIGSRMIGDIDILVEEKDIEKSFELINKLGYHTKYRFKYYKHRHLNRLINNNNLFAIELHKNIINKKNKFLGSFENYFEYYKQNRVKFYQNKIILNHLYNDHGLLKAKINLRVLYDYNKLSKLGTSDEEFEIKKPNIYFFIMGNTLGVTNVKIENVNEYWFFKLRFKLKRQSKIFYLIDESICNLMISARLTPYRLIEFLINKNYRKAKINNFMS